MSAFVVSHKHINTLVSYANRQRFPPKFRLADGTVLDFSDVGDLQHAAEILLAENVRSIQERYPDTVANPENMPGVIAEIGQPIIFQFVSQNRPSPVQILKACACYDYQACETDDYYQTDAHKIIESIRDIATGNLEGYEQAEWEIA